MKNLCPILLLLTAIWSSVSEAGTKELESAILKAVPWDEHSPDAEQRRKFASAIRSYWLDFDSRVPRLSPSEREWLNREMASKGERFERALSSQEYAIALLNRRSDECLRHSKFIIDSIDDSEKNDFEMFGWLQMINCYADSELIVTALRQSNITINSGSMPIQMVMSSIIMDRIVNHMAVMAMVETMGWSFSDN